MRRFMPKIQATIFHSGETKVQEEVTEGRKKNLSDRQDWMFIASSSRANRGCQIKSEADAKQKWLPAV